MSAQVVPSRIGDPDAGRLRILRRTGRPEPTSGKSVRCGQRRAPAASLLATALAIRSASIASSRSMPLIGLVNPVK